MRGFDTVTCEATLHPAFDLNQVDFQNPEDVVSFGTLLFTAASNRENGSVAYGSELPKRDSFSYKYGADYVNGAEFIGDRLKNFGRRNGEFVPSSDTLRKIARNWLREVDKVIDGMTPSEAFKVIPCYDAVHRIAYRTGAFSNFLNKYILQAFESMIRGDKTVDRYDMFRQISAGIKRGDKAYFGRPLQWQSLTLEKWYRQFRSGTGLEDLSERDIAERVSILLETDLWAFDPRNQSAFKHHLLTTYRPYLTPSSQTHPI